MARVLYRSIPPDAPEPRAGFVEAATLTRAEEMLREQGHREIRFFSDPNYGDLGTGGDPEAALRIVESSSGGRSSPWPIVIAGLLAAAAALGGGVWLFLGGRWLLGVLVAAFGFFVATAWLPIRIYDRVRFAMGRRQYRRAHAWLRLLRALCWLGPANLFLRDHFVGEEARILAGSGRLDEALRLIEGLRARNESYARTQLPSLYDHARDFVTMRRVQEERVAADPGELDARVDIALTLALRFDDLAAARHHLEAAQGLPRTETARAVIAFVEGVTTIPADPQHARARIDEAHRYFASQSPAIGETWLALLGAYRARASAKLGERARAERDLEAAVPVLLACGEHELVDTTWALVRAAAPTPYRE